MGDGYLPKIKGKPGYAIQFCNGAPGIVPVCVLGAELFPDLEKPCLTVCRSVGELIWSEGLVLKGNGLCHGISGNGYALHCLHRKFSEMAKNESEKMW